MSAKTPNIQVAYVERPDLDPVYANHVNEFGLELGVVLLELCCDRLQAPAPDHQIVKRFPVARLAIPYEVAEELFLKLQHLVEQVRHSSRQMPRPQ